MKKKKQADHKKKKKNLVVQNSSCCCCVLSIRFRWQRATAATGRLGNVGQCVIFHRSAVEHARSLTRSLSQSLLLLMLVYTKVLRLEEAPKGTHTHKIKRKKIKSENLGRDASSHAPTHTHAQSITTRETYMYTHRVLQSVLSSTFYTYVHTRAGNKQLKGTSFFMELN